MGVFLAVRPIKKTCRVLQQPLSLLAQDGFKLLGGLGVVVVHCLYFFYLEILDDLDDLEGLEIDSGL